MSESTLSNSPSQDGNLADSPSFVSCPPIFVLPTHLTLDELHRVEDILGNRGARLTYDASEARLVLGRVGQKKRAALELRSRGVWTEEVPAEVQDEAPVKRRRVQPDSQLDDGDLSTESEGEEDGVKSQHNPGRHLRKRSPSVGAVSVISTLSGNSEQQKDVIKVVKLQWLENSLKAHELLPINSYIVYQARIIENPTAAKPITTAADIVQRAKEDAMFKPPAAAASRFPPRRQKELADDTPSQRHPIPKLKHKVT